MKKFMFAAMLAGFAITQGPGAAMADVVIKIKPRVPVVKKVVVVQPVCYTKTVKTYKHNKVVITKKRVCG